MIDDHEDVSVEVPQAHGGRSAAQRAAARDEILEACLLEDGEDVLVADGKKQKSAEKALPPPPPELKPMPVPSKVSLPASLKPLLR